MNQEHYDIVKRGKDAIAAWQEENPDKHLNLSGIGLREANLRGADLSRSNLSGANLRLANLSGTNLRGANLSEAKLRAADLSEADLRETKLNEANLSGANLSGADFSLANLSGAKLSGADLSRVEFSVTNLSHANLSHANLSHANLSKANLSKANLSGAKLDQSDLTGANLTGANLNQSDLTGALLYSMRISRYGDGGRKLRSIIIRIWPTKLWFLLDRTHIANTRFDASSRDPYSILRRTYTGPKLTFVFFFSVLALLPLIGHAVFWSTVSQTEARLIPIAVDAVEETADCLRKSEDQEVLQWVRQADKTVSVLRKSPLVKGKWKGQVNDLQRLVDTIQRGHEVIRKRRQQFIENTATLQQLDEAASWKMQAQTLLQAVSPQGGVTMEERRVWELVLGVKHGLFKTALTLALLLYNFARALLTYRMSSLRDNEERTGDSPALRQYWWLWRVHQVASSVLYVSVVSGLWRIGEMMMSVVLVPT